MSLKSITIVGPCYPYRGGNSLFVTHLATLLSEKFSVSVVNYKLLYPDILFPGKTQYDESKTAIRKFDSERLLNSVNPLSWFKVAAHLKKRNPDLIIFDWWHPFFGPAHGVISLLLKQYFRSRIIFITENVVSHEGAFYDKILTRFGLQSASAFLVLSEKVADEVIPYAKSKTILKAELPIYDCYDEVNTHVSSLRKDLGWEDKKVLLFFGYVRKYKGLDILIRTLSVLLKTDPDYRLLIAGEFYDNPDEYTDLIQALDLQEKIHLVNRFVANEEVGNFYTAADVVVLPYRSATQSGVLNVAYGFRVPVIVTDVGGLAEFVENKKTGLVVSSPNEEKLAEGIKEFFSMVPNTSFTENIGAFIRKNKFFTIPLSLSNYFETVTTSKAL